MQKIAPKGFREAFANFFESPTRDALRRLITDNVGETRQLDFKEAWPDHPSIAKQVLGFGNIGNACIVVGIKENDDKTLDPIGLRVIKDKADVFSGIKKFIPNTLLERLSILDFQFEAAEYPKLVGKSFQVLMIEPDDASIPYVSLASSTGIRVATIYVRREAQTEEATHEEVQGILNRRVESKYSSRIETNLKQELEQLRVLYSEIPRSVFAAHGMLSGVLGSGLFSRNPNAPEETFEEFVLIMIDLKKSVIAKSMGIPAEALRAHASLQRVKNPKPAVGRVS